MRERPKTHRVNSWGHFFCGSVLRATAGLRVGGRDELLAPTVRAFRADEWRTYKDLRLRALADSPDAFGSTLAGEEGRTDAEWSGRLGSGAHSHWDLPLVAEVGGEPIGLAWGRIDPDVPKAATLYQMWVSPGHRGLGAGRMLLQAVIAWARERNAAHLDLDVTCGDRPARRLYDRAGFQPMGGFQPLRPGSELLEQPMRLDLGGRETTRMTGMHFHKYQALGNDYVVLERADLSDSGRLGGGAGLTPALVRGICDRHLGVGSDGILLETAAPPGAFGLRIFNPDGSEAEKSGNGLRIFARYLWDTGRVAGGGFAVVTPGGLVRCEVRDGGRAVFVEMGRASFHSERIPVAGPAREVVGETLEVEGGRFTFTAVTVGNPHCVIHVEEASPALAQRVGPLVENHASFPNRTNVQFVQVLDPSHLRIEIWERGAGYTLASGSSACAAAAASVRLGLCEGGVTVAMPGGKLEIGVAADFELTMLGPVEKVASGTLAEELLARPVS